MRLFEKKSLMFELEKFAVKRALSRVVDYETYRLRGDSTPFVQKFEKELSLRFGTSRAVGLNSGTDALVCTFKALGVMPSDEVIVPAFGCTPIAASVVWAGARPVFVDIKEVDYAIDSEKIEEKITPQTKAIVVAHLFGDTARDIEKIFKIARERGLHVIEDTAQSFGAKIKIDGAEKPAGAAGDIGCLSFSSTKLFFGLGSGGAIVTSNAVLEEKIRRMRLGGAITRNLDYPVVAVNASLQEINAAALLAKLPFFEYWLDRRRTAADYYKKLLSGVGDILLPNDNAGRVWYRYVIRTKYQDRIFDILEKTFYATPRLRPAIHYPVPLPSFSAFKYGHTDEGFPVASRISSEVISLPLHNLISISDIEAIASVIRKFFGH